MNTLTITIGILAPLITFLIGRYFRSAKIKELRELRDDWIGHSTYYSNLTETQNEHIEALTIQNTALLSQISNLATVQLVPNKDF